MARAKRHYIPGQIWHITHRCHKREFLLKFAKDRRRWLQWLFEAKRRYGLSVLNYTVTSNHIHLLVADDKSRGVIPDSIKLIAGRTGQEFNQRKARKGAYWEDRYHATAIEDGDHLIKCIVGSEPFIENVKVLMGGMALGRKVLGAGESFQLKEMQYPYIAHLGAKKSEIGAQNTYVWDQNFENATT